MWTLLYRAAWAAARAVLPLVASGDGKLARGIRGRRDAALALTTWSSNRDTSRPLVWFHAASVGEGRQAEAVLVRLRARHPAWQIVFTHSSASAEVFARSLPADYAGYVPADAPTDTALALDAVRPSAIVFSATDLWPELIRQARRRGVPVALISATLAPTSSRRGFFARSLLRETWNALDKVGAIDARDAEALRDLGVRESAIKLTGDTRHDSAAARAASVNRDAPALRALGAADLPLLVAGSTWPADERELLPAIAEARRQAPLALVIAPHEPDAAHLEDLEARITATLGPVAIVRLSTLESTQTDQPPIRPSANPPARPPWDVCIVDRTGVLAELYAAGRIAYVGGGFHDAGLHSVIEPAALGVPVLFGPRWQTSRDARLLLEAGGGVCAQGGAALTKALRAWLDDPAARAAAGAAARSVVDGGVGAADRSLALVESLIPEWL